MSTYRSAFVLICAVWFLQLAGGILGIVTPLGLKNLGINDFGIGLVAGLHAIGFMVGAAYASKLIGRVGNIRSFSAGAGAICIGTLIQGLFPNVTSWAFDRFIQGAGFAIVFAAIEAWLGAAVSPEKRGSIIGFYHVIAKAALFLGPLLIVSFAPTGPENFLFAGLFLVAALIPICLTRQPEPLKSDSEPLPVLGLLRVAPAAVFGVFMAGIINTGTLALLPIFAYSLGPEEDAIQNAVFTYAAVNIGGLLLQWPLGWLSDRMDRRTVVAICSGFSALMAGLVWALTGQIGLGPLLLLLGGWGAGSLTFYGLCVAHGIDRAASNQITQLMSGLLFVWAVGSIIGPIILGFGMETGLGPQGLLLMSSLLSAGTGLFMITRRVQVQGPDETDQEDWTPTVPRSVVGSELDPRTEEN